MFIKLLFHLSSARVLICYLCFSGSGLTLVMTTIQHIPFQSPIHSMNLQNTYFCVYSGALLWHSASFDSSATLDKSTPSDPLDSGFPITLRSFCHRPRLEPWSLEPPALCSISPSTPCTPDVVPNALEPVPPVSEWNVSVSADIPKEWNASCDYLPSKRFDAPALPHPRMISVFGKSK